VTIPYPMTVTLVRRTKGTPDSLGNDTWTEGATPVAAIYAPGSSSEQVQGRDSVTTTATVYVPATTDVRAIDAVIVAGKRYEIDGDPTTWTSPLTGWTPGIEVRLRRNAG